MKNSLNKKTGVISQSSSEEKTLGELLSKFLERGEITVRRWELSQVRSTSYGDADYLITVELNSAAQMSRSPAVTMEGVLPLHVDYAGKISLGFHCGSGIQEETDPHQFWRGLLAERRKLRKNCFWAVYAAADGDQWSPDYECVYALSRVTARTDFENPFWREILAILATVGQRRYFSGLQG